VVEVVVAKQVGGNAHGRRRCVLEGGRDVANGWQSWWTEMTEVRVIGSSRSSGSYERQKQW